MEFYFVRHGESDYNKKKMLAGQVDVGLTPLGEEGAKKTGKLLSKVKFDKVFSSDLKRAIHTAELIIKELEFKPELTKDSRIKEVDFGDFSGEKSSEVREKFPLFKKDSKFVHPNGESYYEVGERVKKFLNGFKDKEKTILVVSHGGVIRFLLSHFRNEPHDNNLDIHIPNAAVLHVIEKNGEVTRADWFTTN